MRRRALLAASGASGGDNIFPMYLYTEKIDFWTYSHGPSPESIAFIDYYLANAEFDSWGGHMLNLPEGCLFIDDVCVRELFGYGETIDLMNPFPKYFAMQTIGWILKGTYKGQLFVTDED